MNEFLSEVVGEPWSWQSFFAGVGVAFAVAFILIQIFGWEGKK